MAVSIPSFDLMYVMINEVQLARFASFQQPNLLFLDLQVEIQLRLI